MSVTIKDIANETGLSWPTVSRILNGKGQLFKEETRDRVIKKAQEMGYVPNAAARRIKSDKTYHIGALLLNTPDHPLHYPASFEILQGINQSLEQAGYVLSLIRISDIHEKDPVQSRVFREKMLDGMVCLDALPENLVQVVKKLVPRCVWLDSNHKETQACVYRDEENVGEVAAEQMLALKYPKIKFLSVVQSYLKNNRHFSHDARFSGIKKACKKHGVQVEHVFIPHWTTPIDPQLLTDLWQEPAGLIVDGPHDVARIIRKCGMMSLPVGRKIGIASCDMTEDLRIAMPGLAHVSNDRYHIGQLGAEMILKLLKRKTESCPAVTVTGKWVAGDTACGP
ncbi:MAG: hypothetical protein CMJ19_25190 [Phycisphaeraceae bacterium]|nr:hypothetical protein [Phycisphaeraceae bacterium]